MIDPGQFRDLVIRPTLAAIGKPQDSEAAVQLLLATALHESNLTYLRQLPDGPALGVYQMEPATHGDHAIWLARDESDLYARMEYAVGFPCDQGALVTDLSYATAMARIHYWRVPEALPEAGDRDGMTRYWSKYYQTQNDPVKEAQFAAAWDRHADVIMVSQTA